MQYSGVCHMHYCVVHDARSLVMCQYPPVVTGTIAVGPAYACCSSHVLHWSHTSSHTFEQSKLCCRIQCDNDDDHCDDDDC